MTRICATPGECVCSSDTSPLRDGSRRAVYAVTWTDCQTRVAAWGTYSPGGILGIELPQRARDEAKL